MAINNKIEYEKLEKFQLDSQNPRFERDFRESNPTHNRFMNEMEEWKLDELAVSFLSCNGFWVQEAVLVLLEKRGKSDFFTVIEGNRRIAALYKLRTIIEDPSAIKSKKWRDIAALAEQNKIKATNILFNEIPYIRIEKREDVDEFLGFRHVTGIEEWQPAEKAAYIAKLIDERKMTYEEVMQKIGSRTTTVRQLYITFRLMEQMREEDILPKEGVQNRFSVMYLSLRTPGVQQRLGLDMQGLPDRNRYPVEKKNLPHLKHFARWIFGEDSHSPLFSDSRQVDAFGGLLENDEAFKYLCENKDARFDTARTIAGGDLSETIINVKKASEYIRMALSQAHRYPNDKKLQNVMKDFSNDAIHLMSVFQKLQSVFREIIEDKFKN
jgi:uncharacterized protein YerC